MVSWRSWLENAKQDDVLSWFEKVESKVRKATAGHSPTCIVALVSSIILTLTMLPHVESAMFIGSITGYLSYWANTTSVITHASILYNRGVASSLTTKS